MTYEGKFLQDSPVFSFYCRELHKDKDVTFAGYKIPHPLEYVLLVKLSTNGVKSPIEAGKDAIMSLKYQIADLNQQFTSELSKFPYNNR